MVQENLRQLSGQNASSQPLTVRIKFRKVGALQYISHLDLVRTMGKIIVRAGLPLWYTEGFNPHPKMTFAAPLSIGVESLCEYMDLRLTQRCDPQRIADALNANMTDEMQVSEVYYPERGLSALAYLSYEVRITSKGADAHTAQACDAALHRESLPVEKKTKSGGVTTVDVRPLIRRCDTTFENGQIVLRMTLRSAGSAFLNPEVPVRILRQSCGILCSADLLSESYSILRVAAYCEDMTPFS